MNSIDFYQESLDQFNKHIVEYLVVGGYAVNSYGFMRSTGDMDLWVSNDEINLDKLSNALKELDYHEEAIRTGMIELKENRNISLRHDNFFKIELISFLSSTLSFKEAFGRKAMKTVLGLEVGVVEFEDLCYLKIKLGRNKDLLDVKELKRIRNGEK